MLAMALVMAGVCNGLLSCSQYSNKPISKAYHNLTAHYNAYVIARDRLKEAETILFKTRQENYNQILPIYLPLDSTVSQPVKAQLDDAIKKASMIAERHQNSKWLDDGFVIIGKARLHKQQLDDAMEVFKYVNTRGTDENDKHQALIGLMRAYVETGDYGNGLNVAEYLRAQPLTKANTRDYYLTKAYLHQKKGEYAVAAAILDATFPMLKKGESTARLHLIAGQLYDVIGQSAKASEHFASVLQSRPTYDQSFYANIYLVQSQGLTSDGKRAAQATNTFNRMLEDRKNADLQDKIYYTMGLVEARRGNYDKAVDYYRKSIQTTTTNTAQIPYTYLELGKLYFEHKNDYVRARMYYDSSLALLPAQAPQFAEVANRKKVLDEYVDYYTTIQTQDSLQRLAQMNPAALDKFLDNVIAQREQQSRTQAALAQQAANRPSNANNALATTSDLQPNERWYLYNPVRLSQGRQEFTQRWGNRPLEDNWRRSTKEASAALAGDNNPLTGANPANAVNPVPAITANPATDGVAGGQGAAARTQRDALYAQIPLTREAMEQSKFRMENAYYGLGKLYKFQLNQPADAISTFEQMLTRFPNSGYKPEVYYLLHLSNEQAGRTSGWKEKLLAEFPNSSYARLAGRSAEGTPSANSEIKAQQVYTDAYAQYKAGNYPESLSQVQSALATFAGSHVEDKLALLRVMLIGRVDGADAYRQALSEFIRDYPASSLVPHVKELQAAADGPTAKRR
ncbi:hypothetical protein GCM10023189_24500 [Nibrella saemangeumensis]|uniref:Tetratricopeptide repeat protein n=2 Tax=Nibrella saemangeumensis TaxID=1084526 RepID=A0ABP8MXD3_9BACT